MTSVEVKAFESIRKHILTSKDPLSNQIEKTIKVCNSFLQFFTMDKLKSLIIEEMLKCKFIKLSLKYFVKRVQKLVKSVGLLGPKYQLWLFYVQEMINRMISCIMMHQGATKVPVEKLIEHIRVDLKDGTSYVTQLIWEIIEGSKHDLGCLNFLFYMFFDIKRTRNFNINTHFRENLLLMSLMQVGCDVNEICSLFDLFESEDKIQDGEFLILCANYKINSTWELQILGPVPILPILRQNINNSENVCYHLNQAAPLMYNPRWTETEAGELVKEDEDYLKPLDAEHYHAILHPPHESMAWAAQEDFPTLAPPDSCASGSHTPTEYYAEDDPEQYFAEDDPEQYFAWPATPMSEI